MYDSKGIVSPSLGAIYEIKIKFTTNTHIVKGKNWIEVPCFLSPCHLNIQS